MLMLEYVKKIFSQAEQERESVCKENMNLVIRTMHCRAARRSFEVGRLRHPAVQQIKKFICTKPAGIFYTRCNQSAGISPDCIIAQMCHASAASMSVHCCSQDVHPLFPDMTAAAGALVQHNGQTNKQKKSSLRLPSY